MHSIVKIIGLCFIIGLSSCVKVDSPKDTAVQQKASYGPGNFACSYLASRPKARAALILAESEWGIKPSLILAIIKKESSFNPYAIGTHTSYGYAQAKEPIWTEYQQLRKRPNADRTNLVDSIDFIAWLVVRHAKQAKSKPNDVYHSYLYYRLGVNGATKTPPSELAKRQARDVVGYAKRFKEELTHCREG